MLMHLPFHLVENACETLSPCDIAALACCCKGLSGLRGTVERQHRKWTAAMLEHHLCTRPQVNPIWRSLPPYITPFPMEIGVQLGSGLKILHIIDKKGAFHISCGQNGWNVWMTDTDRRWVVTIRANSGLWETMTEYPHVPRQRKRKHH